jgi:hypothetical protein
LAPRCPGRGNKRTACLSSPLEELLCATIGQVSGVQMNFAIRCARLILLFGAMSVFFSSARSRKELNISSDSEIVLKLTPAN